MMISNKISGIAASLGILLLLSGCGLRPGQPKKTNWNLDFSKESKEPYGLYLTYNSLPLLFPGHTIEVLKPGYRLTNLGYRLKKHPGKSLLIMIGSNLNFNEGEIDSLFSFIENGHDVLLAAHSWDKQLLQHLKLTKSPGNFIKKNSNQKVFLKDRSKENIPYNYPSKGKHINGYFENAALQDTVPYYWLGANEAQQPDCIVYAIGKGNLFLHAAPLVFSNHFLLHQDNHQYLNQFFGYVNGSLQHIYWTDFNSRETRQSDWSVIWKHAPTRYALLTLLLILVIYLIFEMKRKQRIIPVIPPTENTTVAFVETIGRLYYNHHNHTNLAEKMVQHFLEFVRSNYYLNTYQLDADFTRQLAARSGKSITETNTLVDTIKEVQQGINANEHFLYSLYIKLQSFYHDRK